MDLPRFILLKSNANNKFLCYTKQKDNNPSLRFSYQVNDWKDAKNPEQEQKADDDESDKMGFHYLKFEVEKAKSVEGLVHIRSCYNNKYWARKSIDDNYIVAGANEPEEDQSSWSCTLFKPIFLDSADTSGDGDDVLLPTCKSYKIRLLQVSQSCERSVRTSKALEGDDDSAWQLAVGDVDAVPEESSDDVVVTSEDSTIDFTAIDVEASAILPEYCTFMGHNDKYSSKEFNMYSALAFTSSDIGGVGVANKVTPTTVPQPTSIWDREALNCWCSKSDQHYIWLLSSEIMYFAPIKIGNYIALKCVDVDGFVTCACDKGHILVASETSITDKAMLRVGEPVRMREITDATYDLADSRIYSVAAVEKFSDSRSNHTSVDQEGSFQVEYKTSKTMKWSNSTTVNIGVKVSWSAGIPVIGTLGVDISYDHSQTWEWGEEQTEEKTITFTQSYNIPPGKKLICKVMAQKAYCDVPFKCEVQDLMTDGNLRKYTKTDGLYSGCNEFDFNTDLSFEDL